MRKWKKCGQSYIFTNEVILSDNFMLGKSNIQEIHGICISPSILSKATTWRFTVLMRKRVRKAAKGWVFCGASKSKNLLVMKGHFQGWSLRVGFRCFSAAFSWRNSRCSKMNGFFLVASHLFWTRSGLLSPTVRHEILWKQSRCLLLQIWSCFQFFLVLFLRGEDSKNMSQERFLHSPQKLMNFNSDGCHEALFGCVQHLTSKQEGSCWTPWWSLAWNKHRMVHLWFGWLHYMKITLQRPPQVVGLWVISSACFGSGFSFVPNWWQIEAGTLEIHQFSCCEMNFSNHFGWISSASCSDHPFTSLRLNSFMCTEERCGIQTRHCTWDHKITSFEQLFKLRPIFC